MRFQISLKAAVIVQAFLRMWVKQARYQKLNKGMTCLQACARRQKVQRLFLFQKSKLVLMQSFTRCHLRRKHFQRQRWGAVAFQTCFRRWNAQKRWRGVIKAVLMIQTELRQWLAWKKRQTLLRRIILLQRTWRTCSLSKEFFERVRARNAATKLQTWARMVQVSKLYAKRIRARRIGVDYDIRCKQLLVANRSDLYHIFTSYISDVKTVVKKKEIMLFAVNFKIVPILFSRLKFEQLVTELVTIINEDPDKQGLATSTEDTPLTFVSFLMMLILIASKIPALQKGKQVSLAERLSQLFEKMDESGGKQKMGGRLSRNSSSNSIMVYIDSPKLPTIEMEKARSFDIQKWLVDTHFKSYNVMKSEAAMRTIVPSPKGQSKKTSEQLRSPPNSSARNLKSSLLKKEYEGTLRQNSMPVTERSPIRSSRNST